MIRPRAGTNMIYSQIVMNFFDFLNIQWTRLLKHTLDKTSRAFSVTTVCPGSSDPSEKKIIYFHQKMRFTPFINYYDILG